ncbi:MAG: undecaprenyl-phosphate galactose phosphotransferase WbaP [Treponema sp.]|nr:undecaprenyl-phosphate galactose phosphotransferase WbaP [Treponema sp.]
MNNEDFTKYLKKFFPHTSSFLSGTALFFVDAISLFLSLCLSFLIVNAFVPPLINFRSVIFYAIYIPFIQLVFAAAGMYPGIMISPTDEVRKFAMCSFFSFVGIAFSIILSDLFEVSFMLQYIKRDSDNLPLCAALILAVPFATILLSGMREFARNIFCKFRWWGVPAVIYCSGNSGDEIIKRLKKNRSFGYSPAVIINDEAKNIESLWDDIPLFKPGKEIESIIHKHNIKVAILCDYKSDVSNITNGYRYTITVNKNPGVSTSTQHLKDIAGIIGFSSTHNLTFKTNLFLKRVNDIAFILLFLPVLIPVFLILSVLVKCTSKGPVFYGHKRVGHNGKEFKAWKFRSMCIDSQEQLEKILATDPVRKAEWEKDRKFTDDPRVTKFGKILRKTSLDELPQLFNILSGEMSFVGPRPVTESELKYYGNQKDFVLSVKPGLTGMWQVSGRSDTGYEERVNFDTFYIQNWSIWLDIWILIKTVWVVIKGKGAY